MKPRTNRNRAAWLFVISLVVLCGLLTVLQFHWTHDMERAEKTLMREQLAQQAQQFCKSFDDELVKSRAGLVPSAQEIAEGTRPAVFSKRLQKWKADGRLPIFKHMAVLAGKDGELMQMDVESASLIPMDWPEDWANFQENLTARHLGDPSLKEAGWLKVFPVRDTRKSETYGKWNERGERGENHDEHYERGERGREHVERDGGRREYDAVILELDADHLREVWLPSLVAKYFNPKGKLQNDVLIRSKLPPHEVIFSSGQDLSREWEKALSLDFNYFGSSQERPWGSPMNARWVMEVGYRAGSLEAIVAESRRWNLAVVVALNSLILACGWMLVRATRRSRRLAEERMNFVANVTHELRTPLTVIRGAAHNLKRGIVKDPEAIDNYSGLIIKHAEALGAMVDQVLDLSGDRRSKAVRAPMNLWQLLQETAQSVKVDARFTNCRIELDLPTEIPDVTGDPSALRRAFLNLLENAAKHAGSAGVIEVTATMEDQQVEISISDQGPGIPASELEEIFKPFFRGEHSRSKQIRGSGLGLSLVKSIVETHGGSISVRSEMGKGSTFIVILPI